MALLAYRNSVREGVRVKERSRLKSSAAKMRPVRWGDALHISFRFERAFADSIKARRRIGGSLDVGVWRWGRVWRITSVMKWRSEGEFTFGITIVSMLGACNYCCISKSIFFNFNFSWSFIPWEKFSLPCSEGKERGELPLL